MEARVTQSPKLAAGVRERANAKSTSVVLGVKGYTALIVLVLVVAACGGTAHSPRTSASPSHNTSAPPSAGAVAASSQSSAASSSRSAAAAAAASSARPAQEALSCSTDIDPTGAYLPKKDMTAEHLIALLGAMLIVDGRGIIAGTPGRSSTNLLNGAQFNLGTSYFVGQLSADAAKFVADEQTYNPTGPVQASAGQMLEADIRQLMRDCQQSIKDAQQIASG
jgi:hypothetical protein